MHWWCLESRDSGSVPIYFVLCVGFNEPIDGRQHPTEKSFARFYGNEIIFLVRSTGVESLLSSFPLPRARPDWWVPCRKRWSFVGVRPMTVAISRVSFLGRLGRLRFSFYIVSLCVLGRLERGRVPRSLFVWTRLRPSSQRHFDQLVASLIGSCNVLLVSSLPDKKNQTDKPKDTSYNFSSSGPFSPTTGPLCRIGTLSVHCVPVYRHCKRSSPSSTRHNISVSPARWLHIYKSIWAKRTTTYLLAFKKWKIGFKVESTQSRFRPMRS